MALLCTFKMKKTLVIGATPNPSRYAFIATEMLTEYGHEVIPFGIKRGKILDKEIINEFPVDEAIDTVTLYVNPLLQEQYQQLIIDLKPKRVVFNPGTENPGFEKLLAENNIEPIEACTLVMLRTNQY